MKRQKGFSLIELMMVIAIIGILAGVAIPAYSDYVVRAKLIEIMPLLDKINLEVNENYAATGKVKVSDPAGMRTELMNLSYVGNAAVLNGFNMVSAMLLLDNTGSSAVDGKTWRITYRLQSGKVAMQCINPAGPTFVPDRYLPPVCR